MDACKYFLKTCMMKLNSRFRMDALRRMIFDRKKILFYVCVVVGIISVVVEYMEEYEAPKCWRNHLDNETLCQPVCEKGTFVLKNMSECHSWLTCCDLERDVTIKQLLVESTVKKIQMAEWKGHTVIISELQDSQFQQDFDHNLEMLRNLSPSKHLVQLVGFCNNSAIITEYHRLGSAVAVQDVLKTHLPAYDSIGIRVGLCTSYISILNFFHNASRVMCDSSTLPKTLSQYLLTDDLRLVANDLDALPKLDPELGGVVCGSRELQGDFVAPEQRWPYKDKPFDSSSMPSYDEKSDIWKVPDVCEWFLGTIRNSEIAKLHLFELHKSCKEISPKLRPTAQEILDKYLTILEEVMTQKDWLLQYL